MEIYRILKAPEPRNNPECFGCSGAYPSANCDGGELVVQASGRYIACGRNGELKSKVSDTDWVTATQIAENLRNNPLGSKFGRLVAARIAKKASRAKIA